LYDTDDDDALVIDMENVLLNERFAQGNGFVAFDDDELVIDMENVSLSERFAQDNVVSPHSDDTIRHDTTRLTN